MNNATQTQNDVPLNALEDAGSSRRRTIVLSTLAFLLSYVITAGPAAFILNKMDLPVISAIAEVVYAPIIAIAKMKIPVLSALVKGYIGLFT